MFEPALWSGGRRMASLQYASSVCSSQTESAHARGKRTAIGSVSLDDAWMHGSHSVKGLTQTEAVECVTRAPPHFIRTRQGLLAKAALPPEKFLFFGKERSDWLHPKPSRKTLKTDNLDDVFVDSDAFVRPITMAAMPTQ